MADRTYAQYCGLAYALDLVGERWALLVERELLLGPKRFTELQRGLPGIPSNVLSARLREQDIYCGAAKDGSPVMRLVTHYGVEQADIDRVVDAFSVALGAQPVVAATA